MSKKIISIISLAVLATATTVLFADNKTEANKNRVTKVPQQVQQPSWLGITLEAVPSALSTQLSAVIPKGQGVLVRSVSKDSPAKKAGIQVNDVLLSLDDQKLYSASQLLGLIRTAQPNSDVKFSVVQQGKLKSINVTLGVHKTSHWTQNLSQGNNNTLSWLAPQFGSSVPKPNYGINQGGALNPPQAKVFGSFESVQVRTLADGRYHAEVSYKNKVNESKQFTFEGKREEIIEQIKKHKELPDDKKHSLIQSLNMNLGSMNPFAGLNSPLFQQFFGQGNAFNGQTSLFNDPFFQQGFGSGSLFQGVPQVRMFIDPPSFQQRPLQAVPQQNIPKGSLI